MTTATPSHHRHALLIGIDTYPALPDTYQLKGCARDVETLDRVLRRRFAFPPGSIHRLVDEAATRRGILRALDDLVARARNGDVVTIFFSGHGSQVRDPTRPSGWCESIVPHDSGRGEHQNRDIIDLEIRQRIVSIERRGLYATLIFDACFSGSITRHDEEARARTVERDPRPIGLAPTHHDGPAFPGEPRGAEVARVPHVLITACGEDELSWETSGGADGARQGALTFHLCQELATAPTGTSYRQVFAAVAHRVTAERPGQHPRLEGPRDRQLFGHRQSREAADPGGWATVVERDGPQVTLDVGVVHGITEGFGGGGLWQVTTARRATTADPDPSGAAASDGEPHGTLRVLRVDGATTRAEILYQPRPGSIVVGCRASDGSDPRERYRRFLGARNHPPGSRLAGCLVATLQRQDPSGRWHDIASRPDGAPATLTAGDQVAVALRHGHATPLFVYLLDLGLRGRIAQLFPQPGGAQRLQPGHRLVIGRDDGWPMVLAIPEQAATDPSQPMLTLEHFKIVASSHELDFSTVEQPGLTTPCDASGPTSRGAARAPAAVDWVSLVLPFRLQPQPG